MRLIKEVKNTIFLIHILRRKNNEKNSLIKITTIAVVFTLIFSYIPSLGPFASNVVVAEELDLEEAVEEMPSVDEMTTEERALFDQVVAEQVELHGDNQEEQT